MAVVKFNVPDEIYEEVNKKALELGMSIHEYIRYKAFEMEPEFSEKELVETALNKFKSGDTFTILDLIDIKKFGRGKSGTYGKRFENYIKQVETRIEYIGKCNNRKHNLYKII